MQTLDLSAKAFKGKQSCLLGGATTLSIMALSNNDIQHNGLVCDTQQTTFCIEYHYGKCHYAECRVSFIVMLSVVMLNVVMLNVVAPPPFESYEERSFITLVPNQRWNSHKLLRTT